LANRYDDALLLTRKAIFTAEATKESAFLVKDVIFQWYWQWARLLKKLNLLEKAIAIYQLAISHFQPIRQQVVNTGYRQRQTLAKSYRQEEEVHFSFALYYELIDLLLSQYERHADFKQRQEVLQQLLYVLEKIRKNELRDSFQDICVNLDSKQLDRRIEEFLRSQRENAEWSQIAVIYPILLSAFASQDVGSERRERAEWLVSLPTGIMTLIPMQIPNLQPKKERLQTDVVSFKNKLVSSGKSSAKNYQDNAKKLYDWLIKPLEDEFNKQQLKINTLVMVPDAILREIPLAALYDGHHFLVEKYAVAVTQGLALTDPMQFSHREERRVLLGGVSEEREFDGQKFSSLPSVRHELQSLSELFNEQPYYLDKQFTMQLFETELKSNRHHILHISSHGEFKPNRILDGFVLTYDGKVTLAAIERWLKTSESSVELLTLNACETAKGGSQAMLGLAGVTVQLGIKTTLANLWQVEDSSASELSEAFYQNIQKVELSLAEALRQAQLMLLHGGYKQPYYWAPMILVGNWF
jgi:CHAT domain-containing protein